MREGGLGMKKAVKTVWECVRTVTGDNAYDRYLQHHEQTHPGTPASLEAGVPDGSRWI